MYTKSVEKFQKVVELYKNGEILSNICKELKISSVTFKQILYENGIDYNEVEKVKYQEKLDLALKLYEEGKPQIYIEKELNLTRKTLRNLFKEKASHYKGKSEQWRIRHGNTLDETVFDVITPESAYWLGMLYTDGSISGEDQPGYEITLGLHLSDKDHIEKYKRFLKSSKSIELRPNQKSQCARLKIGSEYMHSRLKVYGFTNEKSYDAKPHKSVEYSRDFWRGCIDGDGGIYNSYNKGGSRQISLCGTMDTVIGFIVFCEANILVKNRKFPTKASGKELYQVSYYGKEAEAITDFLYKDSVVYLDRKYKIYEEWKKDLENSEN